MLFPLFLIDICERKTLEKPELRSDSIFKTKTKQNIKQVRILCVKRKFSQHFFLFSAFLKHTKIKNLNLPIIYPILNIHVFFYKHNAYKHMKAQIW